ncbi:MAG: DUF1552 domain-containing protein [Planctomycetota bacterium]
MVHRRGFIQTALATLALPAMESLPLRRSFASQVMRGPAKRLVCVGNSFGMYQPRFFPKQTGKEYSITPLLKPMERHRIDFSVFSNLDHSIKGGHYAVHSFLSGVKYSQAASMPSGNITLDQRAAEVLGPQTRFPSLTVGSTDGLHGGCQMSWTRSGVRVPPISGPKELFRKLFLNDSPTQKASAVDNFHLHGSILDAALEDAHSLSRKLNQRDKTKLDEYFSSVRDIEQRIQQQEKWVLRDKPKAPIAEPTNDNLIEDLPELFDLIALALETDSTRIGTFEMAGANFRTGILGLNKGYHAYSHHGQDPKNIEGLVKLELYQMKQLARFLDRLKSTELADGRTLFDETIVLFGSGMGNANSHTNSNLPILLAGGGFRLGEHLSYPTEKQKRIPLCNLYVSILQQLGIEDDTFGTSSGSLNGLETG